MSVGEKTSVRGSETRLPARLLAIADEPSDDEDLRRRKRVGVVAGYATIFAPLTLPIEASARPESWILAFGLSTFALANLIVLARSGNFERFVVALIAAGVVFVPAATFLTGGVSGPGSGLVWAFLIPAYAMLALGPRRSVRWFAVYLALVVIIVVVDPIARSLFEPPPDAILVFGIVFNAVVPLSSCSHCCSTQTRDGTRRTRADESARTRSRAPLPTVSAVASAGRGATPRRRSSSPTSWVSRHTPVDRGPTRWWRCSMAFLAAGCDGLADRHGLEKIKTIGNAYMAVAGAREPRPRPRRRGR